MRVTKVPLDQPEYPQHYFSNCFFNTIAKGKKYFCVHISVAKIICSESIFAMSQEKHNSLFSTF